MNRYEKTFVYGMLFGVVIGGVIYSLMEKIL